MLFSWFTAVFSFRVKPGVKPENHMAAGISILCYKSKMLANGAHPLMIRFCKDGKKRYMSLCGVFGFGSVPEHAVQEPCCFRGALHIRRTECGTVWAAGASGCRLASSMISAGFHGMPDGNGPPRKKGSPLDVYGREGQ